MANVAFQVADFAFQGSGQFAFQGSEDVVKKGPGGRKRRPSERRNLTQELFDNLERTLRGLVSGPVLEPGIEIGTAAAARESAEPRIRAIMERMANIAQGDAELTARAAGIRRDIAAYAARRKAEEDEADDEEWMML